MARHAFSCAVSAKIYLIAFGYNGCLSNENSIVFVRKPRVGKIARR